MRGIAVVFWLCLGAAVASWAQSGPFTPTGGPGNATQNQAYSAVAVTPSNTAKFAPTRALYIAGTSGAAACNIVVLLNGASSNVTFTNVQPGEILPVQAILIASSSTTCASTLALY